MEIRDIIILPRVLAKIEVEHNLKLCTPEGGRFLDLIASTRLSQNNFDC